MAIHTKAFGRAAHARQGLALLAAVMTSSCAMASSTAEIRRGWDPWVGQGIDNLIRAWGAPSNVFDLPQGTGKIYTWLYIGGSVVAASVFRNVATASLQTPYCRVDWNMDSSGQVQGYRWEGSCRVVNLSTQ